ncbi:MAG: rRNA maturation RNase YbeY [Thermaurantimonas sp.]
MIYINSSCSFFTPDLLKQLVHVFQSIYPIRIRSMHLSCLSMEDMYEFNKKALNHEYYTDVITFCDKKKNFLDIEMYLSLDYVKRYCEGKDVSLSREYIRTFYHGLLHCIGYTDSLPEEKDQMRIRENELCNEYFKSST